MDNPYIRLTQEFNDGRLRAILASGQAVVLYRLAIMSKDGDWILREETETLTHVIATLARHGARYRYGAPLDLRWLAHGWSSHLEFQDGGLRLRCDFVTRPPRVSPAALAALWEAPVQKEVPVVTPAHPCRPQEDQPREGLRGDRRAGAEDGGPAASRPCTREAHGTCMRLFAEHPAVVAEAAGERPLLSRIGEGREVIERLLDEERRALMRANEDRLDRYATAATRWGAEWPRVSKELAGRPLAEAHEMMVARAAELLPHEP